jgi:hypothetical protein
MRPWKNLSGLASWMMRLAVLMIVALVFQATIMAFNLQSLHFYLAAAFVLAAIFLVIGGFFTRHTTTMMAALTLLILSGLHAYWAFAGLNVTFARYIMLAAISLQFLSNGNKN